MKRLFYLLLAGILLLTGCAPTAVDFTDDVTTTTTATTTTATSTTTTTTNAITYTPATDHERLTVAEIQGLVYDYNLLPSSKTLEFSGAIPTEKALLYFIIHHHLASLEPDAEIAAYLVEDSDSQLPLYKVPVTIVDEWLLQHFTALDDTALSPDKVKDDCYMLYAGGIGTTPVEYRISGLVVQNDVATFISEKTDPAPSELAGLVFLTQRFTLTEKNGYWTITSVEILNTRN